MNNYRYSKVKFVKTLRAFFAAFDFFKIRFIQKNGTQSNFMQQRLFSYQNKAKR